MSGRSIGIISCHMSGVRVLGQLTFIPAHMKNGKEISARATIPVRRNSHRGTDRQGQPGRKDDFKLTVWGKLAEVCARSCSPGKAIDVICEPNSYLGRVFDMNGAVRTDAAGQAIEVNKVGFTVKDIVFGEESAKFIAAEIAEGKRPADWNIAGSPGSQQWKNILTQRQAAVWDGSGLFGYARVVVPQGPGIALMGAAPAAPPAGTVATGAAPLTTQVANALPAAGQPAAPVYTAPPAATATPPAATTAPATVGAGF